LAPVNGKSLLQRNIEYLQQYGITDVIVNVHHFADQIINAIKQNNGWGSNIIISDETDVVLETGGGLLKARSLFTPGERFITCNVDILTELNIDKLIDFHERNSPLISFAISDRKTSRNFLFDESNRLCGWINNTTGEQRISIQKPNLVQKGYSCVVVFEYDIFRLTPFNGKFSLTDLYLELAAQHTILGYDHTGDKWIDVGKPTSVEAAEQLFY